VDFRFTGAEIRSILPSVLSGPGQPRMGHSATGADRMRRQSAANQPWPWCRRGCDGRPKLRLIEAVGMSK
jgi:hypothetical protein